MRSSPTQWADRAGSRSAHTSVFTTDGVPLAGDLVVPQNAGALVVFAHGSGSSRHSPRNQYVAGVLNQARLGTFLFDLLSPTEEHDRRNVFDVDLLARRLSGAAAWLRSQPGLGRLPIGLFGASTGAAAALAVAALPQADIAAVVSRGGRPDLAGAHLAGVRAPTLMIVGDRDVEVIELNRAAQTQLRCPNHLVLVPGATHLFEEPGTLSAVAELTRDWFVQHLMTGRAEQTRTEQTRTEQTEEER